MSRSPAKKPVCGRRQARSTGCSPTRASSGQPPHGGRPSHFAMGSRGRWSGWIAIFITSGRCSMRAERIALPVTAAPAAGAGRRLRVAIFIENDIIYRHFVQSGAFAALTKSADVHFVFAQPGPGNKRLTIVPEVGELCAPVELLPIEPERIYLWRRLFQVSQLVYRPGAEWKQLRILTRYFIGPRASRIFTVAALPGIFQCFRRWTRRQLAAMPS